MGDSEDFRQRAATLRECGDRSREQARRVRGLGAVRWQSGAAERFRASVLERSASLHRLADELYAVAAACDRLAVALDRARMARFGGES